LGWFAAKERGEDEAGAGCGDGHEQPGAVVVALGREHAAADDRDDAARPSAAPIWRNIVWTPIPVENRAGGNVAAARVVKAGRMRLTPSPSSSIPGR
jgi:hypothetical protein